MKIIKRLAWAVAAAGLVVALAVSGCTKNSAPVSAPTQTPSCVSQVSGANLKVGNVDLTKVTKTMAKELCIKVHIRSINTDDQVSCTLRDHSTRVITGDQATIALCALTWSSATKVSSWQLLVARQEQMNLTPETVLRIWYAVGVVLSGSQPELDTNGNWCAGGWLARLTPGVDIISFIQMVDDDTLDSKWAAQAIIGFNGKNSGQSLEATCTHL